MSRKMIAALQVSLDGFTQGTDRGEADWVESWADAIQLVPDVDAFVQGAGMYPGYGEYWEAIHTRPQHAPPFQKRAPSEREIAYAQLAARTPHFVVSKTLKSVAWPPAARIVSDLAELRALKARPGKNIYVVGGPTLVANLLNEDLLDELRLIVHPILLGGGKALFAGVERRRALKLVEARTIEAGRVVLTYACGTSDHAAPRRRPMNIGIIGAGPIGGTLARHLVKLGHRVSIANSRGPESLKAFAAEIGATPVSAHDAARAGEVVVVAVTQKAIPDLPKDLFVGVPESVVVIDTNNYYPELRDGRIEAIDAGALESEWVAAHLGRPVVKAFNNIYAKSLLEKGAPPGTPGRIALSAAGDPKEARATTLRLLDELGFDAVDAGDLADSWRQQPGTPAYCNDLDAASLRRALAEADRSRLAEYRRANEEHVRKLMGG